MLHNSTWTQGPSNIHLALQFYSWSLITQLNLPANLQSLLHPSWGLFISDSSWTHSPIFSLPFFHLFCHVALFHVRLHMQGLSQIHAVLVLLPYNPAEPRNKAWQWQTSPNAKTSPPCWARHILSSSQPSVSNCTWQGRQEQVLEAAITFLP